MSEAVADLTGRWQSTIALDDGGVSSGVDGYGWFDHSCCIVVVGFLVSPCLVNLKRIVTSYQQKKRTDE